MMLEVSEPTPCNQAQGDMWFSEDSHETELAKDACLDCPIFEACRAEGWQHEFGVWGGLSEHDREALMPGWQAVFCEELEEVDRTILTMARAGRSRAEVERATGLTASPILRRMRGMRERGVDVPRLAAEQGRIETRGRPRKYTQEQADRAVELVRTGSTKPQAARKVGMDPQALRNFIRKLDAA